MPEILLPQSNSLTQKKQAFGWDDVENQCAFLWNMLPSPLPFERIVAVARGGLIPATILSHKLRIREFHVVTVKQYDDLNSAQQLELYVPGATKEVLNRNTTLIVDDILDTGRTMGILDTFAKAAFKICLVSKIQRQDILFAKWVHPDTWIDFPWEVRP